MSLEAALDQERLEILSILEGRASKPSSPTANRTASPAPPIRSMLDIDIGSAAPRHGSITGIGVGVTPAPKPSTAKPVRSLLDPQSPTPSRTNTSTPTSPTSTHPPSNRLSRKGSDASKHTFERQRGPSEKQGVDLEGDYQFEMLPSIPNQALPKRVTQGGKKHGSMAAAMTGELERLPGFTRGRDSGRHNSNVGISDKSKSPSSRLGQRSQSPGNRLLNNHSFNPIPTPGTYVTDRGKVIDLNSAYRRLSDAALLKSAGSLSTMPPRSGRSRERLSEGESMTASGEIRMDKDYLDEEGNGEGAIESSDNDEEEDDSSGDEEHSSEASRGRRRNRRKKGSGSEADHEDSDQENVKRGPVGMGASGKAQKVRSLLGAAEEERLSISSAYRVKSLLDPVVTVTGPKDEKMVTKKKGVHPHTSFDHTASGLTTPASSDTEADLSDIKRAQKMSLNLSPIDASLPNRVIRTILRGDYAQMQQEVNDGLRRQRMYFVATDLSDEAVYALEWTIGTILRDGDTLYAVYAVDEAEGTGKTTEVDSSHAVQIGEGAKAIQDTAAVVGTLTEKATQNPNTSLHPTTYLPATSTDSRGGSIDAKRMSKAEQERYHAIDDISQTCMRLLRKTRLQVRIGVEVVHCKSPKHMITEAIDSLEPTLVILGSRGRSALKGVLLGSFSNYLVTKSSIPVMVARKKLKKHAKYKNPTSRLSNNLTNPTKSLAAAKID